MTLVGKSVSRTIYHNSFHSKKEMREKENVTTLNGMDIDDKTRRDVGNNKVK